MSDLSILWSPHDPRTPCTDIAFLHDLHIDALIDLRGERIGALELEPAAFWTCHADTMRLRAAMFTELLDTPGLYEALRDSFSRLTDIFELQNTRDSAMSEEQLLYSIREMEGYLEYLDGIKAIFRDYTVRSELLTALWQAVEPLCTGADYEALCAAVKRQSHAIKNIKSITVGVNLDPSLRPIEAGVIAVHEQSYVSGEPISHLLRLNFTKDDFTCMAPLYPASRRLSPGEQAAMSESITSALRKIFGDSLKSWASLLKSHILGNLHRLTPLAEEWRLIAAAMEPLHKLRRMGMPLCQPVITDADNECIRGLYHPLLALSAERPAAVVRNDLTFDADGRLYILTGPNSGGKSIHLQAVGLAYTMLHLGLPLPAASATVTPTDGIYTHFVHVQDGAFHHGRLGIECERIHAINHTVTAKSLILFDEALSGTNATEAVVISTEILAAYAAIGVRGVWVTHFHDLCRLPEAFGSSTRSRVANLSAQMDTRSHDRLFTIRRGDGAPHSYAMDIAKKFHLTREEILLEFEQT